MKKTISHTTDKLCEWGLFPGKGESTAVEEWPDPPAWRESGGSNALKARGRTYLLSQEEIDAVNAAIYLRRPLLITGRAGVGKSSLAFSIAYRLKLKSVLVWNITTRSTLKEGLYSYDAIGRLQGLQGGPEESKLIEDYLTLGPLGSALHPDNSHPRVILIDEIDKSDIDLPNDLLNVLEEGEFVIPELKRISQSRSSVNVLDYEGVSREVKDGIVRCKRKRDPVVVLTSNGERDFPAPFLRRCIRLKVRTPNENQLKEIIKSHGLHCDDAAIDLISSFLTSGGGDIATDQLLSAIFLLAGESDVPIERRDYLRKMLLKRLTGSESL